MSITEAVVVTLIMSLITFVTRALPFALFKYREPPRLLRRIEEDLPAAIMVILVLFCIKDIQPAQWPHGIPEAAGIAAVIALHLLRRNAMLSIAGGTALYMILIRLL